MMTDLSRRTTTGRRLILLTRLPRPGHTKTRLMPALGPVGAAELQRRMTRHAVNTARAWASDHWASVQVLLTHAPEELVRPWLGDGLSFGRQSDGGLGHKMSTAFTDAFREGEKRVVLVGTDCPDTTPRLLQQAFDALLVKDVVLGPALDGGYYLVGLRVGAPELFNGPQWGTSGVLKQTLRIAEDAGLSVELLEPLPDVDRPEDLPAWQRHAASAHVPAADDLSVIIPCLNEQRQIARAVRSARDGGTQVIVVDGGSTDGTRERAEQAGAVVLTSRDGRAMQQNYGAVAAGGGTLIFLHADSRLPEDYGALVRAALREPGVLAGAFELHIDGEFAGRGLVERTTNRRARARELPYGDQALFLRRETFLDLGGFPDQPIMEDYELVRRLRRRGRIAIAPARVSTSARRWQEHGAVRTTLVNQAMLAGYHLGISPERLARLYRGG